jgi:thiol-disulfide isomerase/thioredoxin
VFLVTLAYIAGVGVPLFIFAYASQRIILRAKQLNKYASRVQQVFGVIMILATVAIYTNYDQTLQLQLIAKFPVLGTVVNGFENSKLVTSQLALLKNQPPAIVIDNNGLFNTNMPAPDFVGINKWLNTNKPVTITSLKGKVVLVDFWTYTCINCIRTLPHVTTWYDKYRQDGFVVIGVHTPEFQFEQDTGNVRSAIQTDNIHYPVAQDNQYATWNNYNNQYWPAEYLIDQNGNIRRTDFGEGNYDQMELAIQTLLKENGKKVTDKLSNLTNNTSNTDISLETYLGSNRMQYYFPNGSLSSGTQTFSLSNNISQNTFSYGGVWTINSDYAVSGENGAINYNFIAGKVYIILRPSRAKINTVKVYLDGQVIDPSVAGTDVNSGIVNVDSDRLYNLVNLHGRTENHILKLEFQTPGIQVYTFTFG